MIYRLNKQQNHIEMSSRRMCRVHQQNILDFCRRELLIGSRCGCLLAQKLILDRYMVLTCTYLLVIFYLDISRLTYYHQPYWYCYFKRKSQQRHLGKQKTGPNNKKRFICCWNSKPSIQTSHEFLGSSNRIAPQVHISTGAIFMQWVSIKMTWVNDYDWTLMNMNNEHCLSFCIPSNMSKLGLVEEVAICASNVLTQPTIVLRRGFHIFNIIFNLHSQFTPLFPRLQINIDAEKPA